MNDCNGSTRYWVNNTLFVLHKTLTFRQMLWKPHLNAQHNYRIRKKASTQNQQFFGSQWLNYKGQIVADQIFYANL